MTGGAIRQATTDVDLILPNECNTLFFLVGRGLPMEIINFLARSNVSLGGAMAVEAPLHVKGLRAPGQGHLIERAVTR